jgi:hypothetical protein
MYWRRSDSVIYAMYMRDREVPRRMAVVRVFAGLRVIPGSLARHKLAALRRWRSRFDRLALGCGRD